jgi:thymidylate synthase (FAD)
MSVKIVAYTQPIDFLQDIGSAISPADQFIAYVARVSNPANQGNTDTASKLMKYLVKNNHWSPFEMAHVTMEIETTRDIARQILRHRSFSFQEFSQRYADPTKDLGFVTREARLQDTKNRQNSIETDDESLTEMWEEMQRHLTTKATTAYNWAIENGIAKEQARAVLPEGLTVSRLYMAGSVRSWIHYSMLRMANGTQKEHREIASECWHEIVRIYPSLSELIEISL